MFGGSFAQQFHCRTFTFLSRGLLLRRLDSLEFFEDNFQVTANRFELFFECIELGFESCLAVFVSSFLLGDSRDTTNKKSKQPLERQFDESNSL